MADRLALVIGSECESYPRLGFTGELADALYTTLTTHGDWLPAGDGLLLDPTATELKQRVRAAIDEAAQRSATLLLAFICHGVFVPTTGDYYLLASDSPVAPNSDTGLQLINTITEQLGNVAALDGLVVLVDACESGPGVVGAGSRWVKVLESSSGRMELLVASGSGSAYDGCFTRAMLRAFETGLPDKSANLLCADLPEVLNAACRWQTARHLAFNGALLPRGDLGLWLVPNRALRREAITGRPAAGLVDSLTRSVALTTGIAEVLADMVESAGDRLQILAGPAGAGKSTLMSLLIRPTRATELDALRALNADFIAAAVFLDVTSTVETVLAELRAQLSTRFGDEFRDAQRAVQDELTDRERFSAYEIEIVRPLARLRRPGRRIRILFDGLDQPDEGCRTSVVSAVNVLSTDERLTHLRVIVGVRSGTDVAEHPDLAHARRFRIDPPEGRAVLLELVRMNGDYPRYLYEQLCELAEHTGGWLIPRLVAEIDWRTERATELDLKTLIAARFRATAQRPALGEVVGRLGALLAAVGVGPTAPLRLICAALRVLGTPVALPWLRSIIVDLGVLVARGHPGGDLERVGLAHATFVAPLEQVACAHLPAALAQAHAALVDALDIVTGIDIDAYAQAAAPRHFLCCGRSSRAIEFLDAADLRRRPIDNRTSWRGWLVTFEDALPPDHPDRLAARARVARWTGDAGEPFQARAMFAQLVEDCTEMFGPDHPQTLLPRVQLANWYGQTGDPARAVAMLTELLPLQEAAGDVREILRVRADRAFYIGQTGDIHGALAQYLAFLPELERLLGRTHPDVLHCKDQYARWTGLAGETEQARRMLTKLLPLCRRVLGPEHSDTLWVMDNLATWTALAGDRKKAVRLRREAVAMRERAFGIEHPFTIITRRNLAQMYADAEDYSTAVEIGGDLPEVWLRVYGPDDPGTIAVTETVADWIEALARNS